jgi:predicted DNA-binding transcriptional regulator AlpA
METTGGSSGASASREPAAVSIREFCRQHNMSAATYYRLQREGRAPDVMRLGPKKVLISNAAAERWRQAREEEARAVSLTRTNTRNGV